jgi:hypothetical protein
LYRQWNSRDQHSQTVWSAQIETSQKIATLWDSELVIARKKILAVCAPPLAVVFLQKIA